MSDQRSRSTRPAGIARHGRLGSPNPVLTVLKFLGVGLAVIAVSATSIVAIETSRTLASAVTFDLPDATQGPPPDIAAMEGGFNILIVGSDRGETEQELKDRGKAELNDVTMILHVSGDHQSAVAVSIPRDMVVPIPSCPKKDGSGNYPRMSGQPINVTLSYGGVPCTILTVQELTGLHIDFAGLITFNGVIEMSNALGGVPVCLAEGITDPYSGFDEPAGTHVLQGFEALAFLRSRHAVGDGSDLTRISSQQVFLSSLVRTLKSEDTLNDLPKLYSIAQAAISNMELSSNFKNADTLIAIARALSTLKLEQVTFVQYPGNTGQPGIYQGKVKPNAALAKQIFDLILADQPFTLTPGGDRGSVLDPNATALPEDPDATADPATPDLPNVAGVKGQTAADQTCSVGRDNF
jgi:LCP family protein required for cell wall assembly